MIVPKKSSLINVHTHGRTGIEDEFSIMNINASEVEKIKVEAKQAYSVGLHPWNVDSEKHEQELDAVAKAAELDCVIAIGEVGLDGNYFEYHDQQEAIFRSQIEIAEKVGKPLIIHCVRAYPDILKIKKERKDKIPWIIHDYNYNISTARKLVAEGCYLSFGKGLFIPGTKVQYIFARIEDNRFFLESDEGEYNITQVYDEACAIQRIGQEEMVAKVAANYKTCFGVNLSE